jgi:hypothetical protein
MKINFWAFYKNRNRKLFSFLAKTAYENVKISSLFAKIDFGENTKTPLFARINAPGNTAFLRYTKIDFACYFLYLNTGDTVGIESREKVLKSQQVKDVGGKFSRK